MSATTPADTKIMATINPCAIPTATSLPTVGCTLNPQCGHESAELESFPLHSGHAPTIKRKYTV